MLLVVAVAVFENDGACISQDLQVFTLSSYSEGWKLKQCLVCADISE
jgi:hypothetical protein